MAEPRSPQGVEKSSSLKNLGGNARGDSPSGKPPSQLNRNPSQKPGDLSPLNADGKKEGSVGSSIKRANRSQKRGSDAAESQSPSRKARAPNNWAEGRQTSKVANRQRELQQKGLISGDFRGLSTDYPSFELLWFDIESKTRHLIQELIDPIVDKLVDNQDSINQLRQEQKKTDDKVENLKETIFQTNGKLDIFEQINLKLANLEAERKILEDKVDYENKTMKGRMEEIDERNEIQTKVFKNLQNHTEDVMKELSELKETYQKQCDLFVSEVDNCNKLIIEHAERLTDYCQKLENTQIQHKGVLDLHSSQVSELYTRMKSAEGAILDLEKETVRLEADKTDKTLFYKTKKKLDLKDLEQDIKLFKNINHCITLDNYLEKYLPIRTQGLINETLRSVLGGKERRRLELYDNEKNSLLYQQLLSDDGGGNIAGLMRELHEKASIEIEEEDKRRKRRLAITEASQSQERLEQEGQGSAGSINLAIGGAMDGSSHTQVPGILEGSMSADQMARQSAQGLQVDLPDGMPGTSSPSKMKLAAQGSEQGLPFNSRGGPISAAQLPSVVSDENVYRLTDLVNSDFRMPVTDKDFELTHEQIIKVCKIILYKFNLASKKNVYERQELAAMINDRISQIEALTKTSLEEVNTFLHTVHQDFEAFLNKHKKEHTSLNMRVLKVTEDISQVVTQTQTVKSAVESYATVLTCLVEFNSIEQALSLQDEDDRKAMHLLGQGKKLKIPEINIGGGSNTSIFDSATKDNSSLQSNLTSRRGPLKAKHHRVGSNPGSARNRNLLQSNFRTANEQAEVDQILNSLSIDSVDKPQSLRAGAVQLDKECLSCAGVPSHTMELFKMACIQYKPSPVNYRNNHLTRKKLLGMRRTLVDKCEEVINNNAWPHGTQDLRTGKIFKDLLQFYGTIDQSIYSDGSGNMHDQTTLPQSHTSFMPAISQRTLAQNSIEDPLNSGVVLNSDLYMKQGAHSYRKQSHPPQPSQQNNGSYLPMAKGIQGSGATLNNPNTKRGLNNTVNIKTGLDSRPMVENTPTQVDVSPNEMRGETPDDVRDSQAQTPPRNENALTPMNRGSSKKNYTTKLPQI